MSVELSPQMFGCDSIRIVEYGDLKFLLLGWNRNTKDGSDQWFKNGQPFDFDYVEEKVVASGATDEELHKSAQEYVRISKLTMEEYLGELERGK